MSDTPEFHEFIAVESDKPGRYVTVSAEEYGDAGRLIITLSLAGTMGDDAWTWLTPDEARKIAWSLERAASDAEGPPLRAARMGR
jgi:hypothetical protein